MANARRSVVLLIEDNQEIAENMAEILDAEGHACSRAASADAALQLLETESPPDAILLDLRMPGLPAADFVAAVRGRPAWASIPIVLVTAALATDIPEDLAVDEVVFKPFQLEELLELVGEVVTRRSGLGERTTPT
jgi:two-component system, chemotaxis family, chemotaxis protein CheY